MFRIVALEIRLADVVDHVVFLPGNHPRLCSHLTEPDGKSAIHSEGITAVFQSRCRKSRRGWQRAGAVLGSMAVGADPVVDRLSAVERTLIQRADQSGVIEIAFIIRQRRGQQRWIGSSCSGRAGPYSVISIR